MNTPERLAIEAECTRLMNRFSWAVDAMDYDQVMSFFVPDCVFSRADQSWHGHAGLRQSLEGRPKDRLTRHLLANTVIDVHDAATAEGRAYCLVFGHRGALPEGAEAPLGVPDSLIHYEAGFRNTDAGWRIARWHIGLCFRKPAA